MNIAMEQNLSHEEFMRLWHENLLDRGTEILLIKLIEKAEKEGGEVKFVPTKNGYKWAIVKTN